MSLKLWLPFKNGTAEGQGLSDIPFTEYNSNWLSTQYMGNVFNNTSSSGYHYIINKTTTEFNFGENDDFTICFFTHYYGAKFSGQSMSYVFSIGRCDNASSGYGIGAFNNGGGTTWFYGSKTYASSHANNDWRHVAFVKKGNNIKVYQSGALVVDTTFNGVYPTYTDNSGLGIGCFHYSGGDIYPNNGCITDFRIYDNAISAKEIQDICRNTFVYYPLESSETTDGSIVSDCSGWGRNAILSGTAADRRWDNYSSSYSCGMSRGLYFNSSGYVHNDSFNIKVPTFTLSFWALMAGGTSGMQHFLFGTFTSWTSQGIGIWRDGTNSYFNVLVKGNSASSYVTLTLPFSPQTFQFFTVVYDGSSVKTYTNGVLQKTVTYSGGLVDNPVFYIANSKYNGTPASENENAVIGEVRFMGVALSAADVAAMYQAPISMTRTNTVYTLGEYKDVGGNLIGDYLDTSKIYAGGWFGGEKVVTDEGNLRLASYNGWETYYWYNTNFANKSLVMEFEYRVVELGHTVHRIHLYNSSSTSSVYGSDSNWIVQPLQDDGEWHYAKKAFTGAGAYVGFCIRGTDKSGTYSRIEFRNIAVQAVTNGVNFQKNGNVKAHHLMEDDGNVQIMKTNRLKAVEFKEL